MTAQLRDADPVSAARRLLGAVIRCRDVSAVVVETEAYGGPPEGPWPDPASHAFRGPSPRNAVMFGPPGRPAARSHFFRFSSAHGPARPGPARPGPTIL